MRKTVPPIRVFDSESVTVWYHPDTKIVHQQFHRFVCGRAFRDALNAGAEAMQTHGARKWLSDDRQNGPLGHLRHPPQAPTKEGVTTKFFSNPRAAMAWLERQ
jgi:hypothetical protein